MNSEQRICRGCGSIVNEPFFRVPNVPVNVGSLPHSVGDAVNAPSGAIDLVSCNLCGLIQNESFNVDLIGFEPGYEVSLVHTPTFRNHIQELSRGLIERYDLRNKRILEIGCGGAEFLRMICELGANRGVGIDPTIAAPTEETDPQGSVRLIPEFFNRSHGELIGDFICCLSVFEDIPEPLHFLRLLRELIGENDVNVYFDVFNGFRAITQQEIWSIHYEQCNYFSLECLTGLFERAGFELIDAGPCYEGDQYLYVEARPGRVQERPSAPTLLAPSVRRFSDAYAESRERWESTIERCAWEGKRVVLWGSGGKGISFLSAIANSNHIDFVVDINPNRQNRFIPGAGQKIVSPDELIKRKPDVVILSNALYRREIESQLRELSLSPEILVA